MIPELFGFESCVWAGCCITYYVNKKLGVEKEESPRLEHRGRELSSSYHTLLLKINAEHLRYSVHFHSIGLYTKGMHPMVTDLPKDPLQVY